jgi:hypothetical protein
MLLLLRIKVGTCVQVQSLLLQVNTERCVRRGVPLDRFCTHDAVAVM